MTTVNALVRQAFCQVCLSTMPAVTSLVSSFAVLTASICCIEVANLAVIMSSQWLHVCLHSGGTCVLYSLHTASPVMSPAFITTLIKC